ncbi:adenosylcobinamide-GDP ribazoletransferase [Ammonicoccus fulvus]|uniref:Adenosylcobinamide-GDP ribazoletransferase n=1 Tax=Ammonicoccus fulvus TaxID=3138240 RepID=A0ABZ3FSH7_9ACTN
MSALSGWRLALGTLTIIPAGSVSPTAAAVRWFVALSPLAVLPLAAGAAGITALGGWLGLPALVTGLLAVGLVALGTRAMHLDAVADVADALGGGWTPERARAILKSGDVGPMGVVALILVIGLQAASVGALASTELGWVLVGVAVALSRWFLGPACWGVPAMPGSSLGAVFARALPGWQAWLWPVLAVVILAGLASAMGRPWWLGVLAGGLALGLALVVRGRARRRFGGMNGDVLGAAIEVALTAMLVVLAWG